MSYPRVSLSIALLVLCSTVSAALAAEWPFPETLNDRNTAVTFEVDSTWHLVKGATKGVHGNLSLGEPADPASIRADIAIPVSSFDTENDSRDERLREVMAAEKFPEVRFRSSRMKDGCDPTQLETRGECRGFLVGTLEVRGVGRSAELPIVVKRTDEGLRIEGSYAFQWAEFGVEDPSILVARLDPTVTVSFRVDLPALRNR